MYGIIHVVVRELVTDKYGLDVWDQILENSGLDREGDFMMYRIYSDYLTMKLVGKVAEYAGLNMHEILIMFGEHFFQYCITHGFDKMLSTLGENIVDFLQNLDSLHALLAISYKGVKTPSFRCEKLPDGSLYLHYYSPRSGLYPIVIGVVTSACKHLFNSPITFTVVEHTTSDDPKVYMKDIVKFHITYEERLCERRTSIRERRKSIVDGFVPYIPKRQILRVKDICKCFPYHILLDRKLRIQQAGFELQKFCPELRKPDTPLESSFKIRHPYMTLSYDNIVTFINEVYVFQLANVNTAAYDGILVSGQMIALESEYLMYICSLQVSSLDELQDQCVYLADIPLYDRTRELILLNQQRIAELDVSRKLDETTVALRRTSRDLEAEKEKTDSLLHELLPEKIAKQLLVGKSVQAEKFEDATVLFSDIAKFTNLCAACTPMDVIDMLNDLYGKFDKLTIELGVYKLGTIGDAYIIIAGVPERTNNHTERVAVFALGMIDACADVLSPASRNPVVMRVGIHEGPVVAGVVGKKQPKYCIFGDTMNTASRMESHGVPGMVHISYPVHRRLKTVGFTTVKRGDMEVKGKGKMTTYFLIGIFQGDHEKQAKSLMMQTYQVWRANKSHHDVGASSGMFATFRRSLADAANGAITGVRRSLAGLL